MKKTIVTIVALLILGVAGSAQAALFEFADYVGYNGYTDGPLVIEDDGLTATFTGFSMVGGDAILTDFSWGVDGVASISFSSPVYVDALDIQPGGVNFTFESFLNGDLSKEAINYILFALEPTVTSPMAMLGIESVEVSATPIPGAVWLLGSGLVGLVGIRRKMAI